MINNSRQKRVLLLIIALLVIANAVTLALCFKHNIFHNREQTSHKSRITGYLKEQLGFDPSQIARYDSLHKKHMDTIAVLFEDMRVEKERRFKYLTDHGFSDSSIITAAGIMAQKQNTLEIKMLQHLRELRGIATAAQRAKFDTTFLSFMSHGKEKNKRIKH